MKNSKEYGKKISKLYRSLKKKHGKVKKVVFDEPAEAIVYAIVSESMRESEAKTIVKKMGKYFVDLNDMRVSRVGEFVEVIGSSASSAEKTALKLGKFLSAIYTKYDVVSLESLKETGKRQAKKDLEDLGILSRFAINYCFLTALSGHAIPLTEKMFNYLRACELVHPDSSDDDIEGFLERQVTAANGFEFYSLLREESDKSKKKLKKTAKKKAKKKATTKKKVKKKTKKKTKKTKKSTKTKKK